MGKRGSDLVENAGHLVAPLDGALQLAGQLDGAENVAVADGSTQLAALLALSAAFARLLAAVKGSGLVLIYC